MTSLVSRLPRPATERGRDALGAGALAVVIALIGLVENGLDELVSVDMLAALVACAALAWRRAFPLVVLVVCAALVGTSTLVTGDVATAVIPMWVALYTAVSRAPQIPAGLALGALAVVFVGGVLAIGPERAAADSVVVSAGIWMALVTAVGIAMNLYRRTVAQERERARQAEETREAVARGRVAEERLRIARELHDAVGHHVAVMNVQAGVAEALLDSDPAHASEALERVQEAGARVLEELPVMLRVLRQGEEDTRPTAGLALLDELVAQARDAGLEVTVEAHDVPDDLPSATDHAAYRIVQEALANARRYGEGAASVAIASDGGILAVEVRNAVDEANTGAQGTGFGLVGMAERAVAAGGTVAAGREGDEFVVRAALPARRGAEA
ncbi:sensor histidine kinase [Demequina mangrovi]|uniref:histidine kinase n=1 Tax=Demequina mangrovi TaxID=1043493 RepID=A0A1H6UNX0_9MICO|nr:histidine kinase [Demequina mangrovi]SEI92394.1 Signal transduction histidine kinase [Demequina mangrovi]